MKEHSWEHEAKRAIRYVASTRYTRYGFGPCLRCGQDFETERPTTRCVCWKMRLPKRTKETKQ